MPEAKISIKVELTVKEHQIYKEAIEKARNNKTTVRAVIVNALSKYVGQTMKSCP